jgi:hypothetical protein
MLKPHQEDTELARLCLTIRGSHSEQCGQLIDIVEKFRPNVNQLKPVGRVLEGLRNSGAALELIDSTRKKLIEIATSSPKAETDVNIDSIQENCPVRLKVKLGEFQFVAAMKKTTHIDAIRAQSTIIDRMQATRASVIGVAFAFDWLCKACETDPGYVGVTEKAMITQSFFDLNPDNPGAGLTRESVTLLKVVAWQTRVALLEYQNPITLPKLREISGALRDSAELDKGATISISEAIKNELALLSLDRRDAIIRKIDARLREYPTDRPNLNDLYRLLITDTEIIRRRELAGANPTAEDKAHANDFIGDIARFQSLVFLRRAPLFELDLSAIPSQDPHARIEAANTRARVTVTGSLTSLITSKNFKLLEFPDVVTNVTKELDEFRASNPLAAFTACKDILETFSLTKVNKRVSLGNNYKWEGAAFKLRAAALCNLIHLSGSHDLNSFELRELSKVEKDWQVARHTPVQNLINSLTEDHKARLRDLLDLPHKLTKNHINAIANILDL